MFVAKKLEKRGKDIFSTVKINDRVQLTYRDNAYLSRVEDVRESLIFLAVPMAHGKPAPVRVGDEITVNVFLDYTMWSFAGVIRLLVEGRVPYLVVSDFRDTGKVQNREYVRVPDKLPVRYRRDTGKRNTEPWREATAFDVSGGGIQMACESSEDIVEREFVEVEIVLPTSDAIYTVGRVVRSRSNPGYSVNLGVEMVQVHPSDRRKIVQYVQKKQALLAASQR